MRLIDAEDIPYTMLYKENLIKGTGKEAQGSWKSDIDKMPTIDAIPVVRCGECRWWNEEHYQGKHDTLNYCENWENLSCKNDYCSYGERRSDDTR